MYLTLRDVHKVRKEVNDEIERQSCQYNSLSRSFTFKSDTHSDSLYKIVYQTAVDIRVRVSSIRMSYLQLRNHVGSTIRLSESLRVYIICTLCKICRILIDILDILNIVLEKNVSKQILNPESFKVTLISCRCKINVIQTPTIYQTEVYKDIFTETYVNLLSIHDELLSSAPDMLKVGDSKLESKSIKLHLVRMPFDFTHHIMNCMFTVRKGKVYVCCRSWNVCICQLLKSVDTLMK